MSKIDERAQADLDNWGRAMADDWLEDHLGIGMGPTWKHYVSGKSFDEPETFVPPTDEIKALETEAIINKVGAINPDYYEILVAVYPKRRKYGRIAKDMSRSVPWVRQARVNAELLFLKLWKK